jgi:hypothetical protein
MKGFIKPKKIFILIMFVIIAAYCKKKEEPDQKIILRIDKIIENDALDYLYNTRDFMESFMFLKKKDFVYYDSIAKPSQFEKTTGRNNTIMKFGILCSDIAYAKILGQKVPMYEYEQVLSRYIADLNISDFFYSANKDYFEILSTEQLTDSLFDDMVIKFRAEHKSIIDRTYDSDEEFLLYFTLGVAVERLYLQAVTFNNDKSGNLLSSINEHNKNVSKENKLQTWKFFTKIYQSISDKPDFKEMKNELDKIMDVIDFLYHKIDTSSPYSFEDVSFIYNKIGQYRNNILNN